MLSENKIVPYKSVLSAYIYKTQPAKMFESGWKDQESKLRAI